METEEHVVEKSDLKRARNSAPSALKSQKGIVVEFVGPPGSGKTTNCEHFLRLLRFNKFRAFAFRDVKKYLYAKPRPQRLRFYIDTIIRNRKILAEYSRVLRQAGIFRINAIYRYAKLLIFDSALQEFIRQNNVDVVLLDQWAIQGLWSATIFNHDVPSGLSKRIRNFFLKTDIVIYFDADIQIASERIAQRSPTRSRFDKMTSQMRVSELEKYNLYLTQLYGESGCENKYIFSARETPDKNAERFMDLLTRYIPLKVYQP